MRERLFEFFAEGWAEPVPGSLPQAAVLLAVTDEPEPRLVLTRRADQLNTHAGEVAFPGGKRDEADTTLAMTALRETEEEIGLSSSRIRVLGGLDPVVSRFGLEVYPYVGLVQMPFEPTPNQDEIESVFAVPLRYFLEQGPEYMHEVAFQDQTFRVPAWRYQDYVIWGLTAFVIVNMMNRVYDAGIEWTWPSVRQAMRGARFAAGDK